MRTRLSLGAKVTALYVSIWNVAPAVFLSTITDSSLVGDSVLWHRKRSEVATQLLTALTNHRHMLIYVRRLRPQPSIECTAGLNCCVLMDVRQSIPGVETTRK